MEKFPSILMLNSHKIKTQFNRIQFNVMHSICKQNHRELTVINWNSREKKKKRLVLFSLLFFVKYLTN